MTPAEAPLTDFLIDLEVRPIPLDQIRAKAKAGDYSPVKNSTMAGYVQMSGRK